MALEVIDPTKLYMVNGEVCQLTGIHKVLSVSNNQTVVAAVTGKRIRIMGLSAQSGGTTPGVLTLKSASGGTTLIQFAPKPNTLGIDLFPIVNSGYHETVTGEGLFADCATTAIDLTVYYIIYKPT